MLCGYAGKLLNTVVVSRLGPEIIILYNPLLIFALSTITVWQNTRG